MAVALHVAPWLPTRQKERLFRSGVPHLTPEGRALPRPTPHPI